jgi:hypothetical protein
VVSLRAQPCIRAGGGVGGASVRGGRTTIHLLHVSCHISYSLRCGSLSFERVTRTVTYRVKTERAKLLASKQTKMTPMTKAPAKLSSAKSVKLSKLPALEKELTLSGPSKKQPLPSVSSRWVCSERRATLCRVEGVLDGGETNQ